MAENQHPKLSQIIPKEEFVPEDCFVNCFGVLSHKKYSETFARKDIPESYRVPKGLDINNQSYYEWISIIEAVDSAKDQFTMYELGAGWAPWLMNANGVLNQRNNIARKFVGLEADPTRFEWMVENFQNNGLNPDEHVLLGMAVSDKEGFVDFWSGKPNSWHGNYVKGAYFDGCPDEQVATKDDGYEPPFLMKVKAISLKTLLTVENQEVDLIHSDTQGAEMNVFTNCRDELQNKVKRVHIATHGDDIEDHLRGLFGDMGWKKTFDFTCNKVNKVPYGDGEIEFLDGIQEYINPNFI